MKNKSLRMKILSGILCSGLAFSTSSVTFATINSNGCKDEKVATSINFTNLVETEKPNETRSKEMRSTLEAVIKDSIGANIITQTEGDKVLEYVAAKHDKRSEDNKKAEKGGLFENLVNDGILTKEKSETLKEKMHTKKTELKSEQLKKGLDTLVASKVLTAQQRDKVKEALDAGDAARSENYKKMKHMSKKEKKAHMKKMKKSNVNSMKALLDNGTITKEQEVEIQKIIPHYNNGKHGCKNCKKK
jgi:hypothetical protein